MCERLLVALTQKDGLWNLDIAILCRPSEVQKVHEGLAWALPRRGVYGSSLYHSTTAPHTEVRPLTPQAQCLGRRLTHSSLPK